MVASLVDLEDIVSQGVAIDVYKAEQCKSLLQGIGKDSSQLNTKGYGELFGNLQGYMIDHLILSITKIFEPYSPRYNIRSIPAAIMYLENESGSLVFKDRLFVEKSLLAIYDNNISFGEKSDQEITLYLVKHMRDHLPSVDEIDPKKLSESMDELKYARDKKIAHHESIEVDSIKMTTWKVFNEYIDYSKLFVSIVGRGYLGILYTDDKGVHFLTADAERSNISLGRLLKVSGIV